MTQLVPDIRGADPTAAGLLIECRGQDAETLKVGTADLSPQPILRSSEERLSSIKAKEQRLCPRPCHPCELVFSAP